MSNRAKIYVISDTHFGHANIIDYCARPFADVNEMNECLVSNWNETVRDSDIVYHLGDVYFRDHEPIYRLKGRKRLLLGNHDDAKGTHLSAVFEKIMLWRKFPEYGAILSHMPLHESVLESKGKEMVNVHGHIHDKADISARHINVSVEQTNYKPILLEDALS